jgi:hypothetical protein
MMAFFSIDRFSIDRFWIPRACTQLLYNEIYLIVHCVVHMVYYYTRTRLNKTLMKKRISFVSPSLFRAPAGARATRPLLFAFAAFALAIPKSLVTSKTVSTISFADTRVAFTTMCDRIQPITDYAWCGLRFFHGEGRLDIMDHDSHPNFRR